MPPYELGHASSVPSSKLLPTTPTSRAYFSWMPAVSAVCRVSGSQGWCALRRMLGREPFSCSLSKVSSSPACAGKVRRSALGCRVCEGSRRSRALACRGREVQPRRRIRMTPAVWVMACGPRPSSCGRMLPMPRQECEVSFGSRDCLKYSKATGHNCNALQEMWLIQVLISAREGTGLGRIWGGDLCHTTYVYERRAKPKWLGL